MFQKILIASAATFLAATAATAATDATAASSPAALQKKAKKPASEQKYCLQIEASTGTRVNRKECKTKSQWAREGVNVDELIRS